MPAHRRSAGNVLSAVAPVPLPAMPVAGCDTVRVTDGLALERRGLDQVAHGASSAHVHIWRPSDRALVMPRSLARGRRVELIGRQLGYPVVIRDSGGDVVPQLPGVLNVALSFAIPQQPGRPFSVDSGYDILCQPLSRWLRDQGLAADIGAVAGAFCDGRFNVTVGGRKIAGTAQRWRHVDATRKAVLAHAVLLVDPDLSEMVRITNGFYRLCGINRHCDVNSHTTLRAAVAESGCASISLPESLRRLRALYRDYLSALWPAIE